ncbi:hypothetical protein [Nocardioides sp. Soil805]|uniref:hypothetical protein n=1 Tax=Nocardioides sp. Soil805 TaxID=1736416 RepID=UPI0007035800|nr:hypothetical protein [Nocardioides sp. Soil805]KRF36019.1 hypothetical protein ASG94_00555 [Nocardioides sp. Soil805]
MPEGVEFTEAPDAPRNQITLRIIAQDPSVTGDDGTILTAAVKIPWSRMEDGPRGARFHVVDFDASTGRYVKHPGLPNDDAFADAADRVLETDYGFHAQQVYAAASRTLATFESALGRRLSWGFNGHHLHLVPHAFAEANAYYASEDRALLFGYVPAIAGRPTYTCLSYDVVVHETTHAVLDGLRSRFLEPGLPDQAGFHEGFADIVALLSVFSMRPVVEQCLGRADKAGRIERRQVEPAQLRSGVLAGVAEQIGQVLTQGRGALRRSAMHPPPADWADLPQFQEPHRRGEVLVAVVLDLLIDIWVKRLEPLLAPEETNVATLDRVRAAEEGARAASQLLTMLIRGLDYLPPVEFEFGDLLDAVLLADAEVVPDDDLGYRDILVDRFEKAGIHRPRNSVTDVLDAEVAPHYLGFNFAALRSDRDEIFRFLWQNALRLGIATKYFTSIESVRPSQRIAPDGLIVVETVATYVQLLDVSAEELEEITELNIPDDLDPETPLQLLGGGTLVFDQFGRLKLHIHKDLDDWRRQLRRVEYLHRTGRSDRSKRLGFSDGAARGQAFAELHNTELNSGEAW